MRWPIALVASVYIACALWLPDGGFWINDNGLKFIQVEGLLRPGPTSFAIDWPGAAIDPSYRFGPITRGFRHVSDGEVYAAYSPFFALLSAVPFRAFGLIGLYLLPLLGGLLSLWAVQQLASWGPLRVSSLYRTEPLGDPDQPWYVNAVVEVESSRSAPDLLVGLKQLEQRAGRPQSDVRWAPRILDLDLLLCGDQILETPR